MLNNFNENDFTPLTNQELFDNLLKILENLEMSEIDKNKI